MPLISICLPTYNRSACLKQALHSLVVQKIFQTSELVEIVISDNCSTDDTPAVAAEFMAMYPSKIHYFCNERNVGAEANCALAMLKGNGDYLKLYNDYLFAIDGSLDDMVNVLSAVKSEKPLILLTNGNIAANSPLQVCNTMDELVTSVSYYLTWIASMGFWKSDFNNIVDYTKYISKVSTHLPQTYYLLDLFNEGRRAIVLSKNYFLIIDPGKKSGYNVAEVFGQNYLAILRDKIAMKKLSHEVFEKEKREVLLKYTIPNYFDPTNNLNKTGFFKYLGDYKNDDYFFQELEKRMLAH